MKPISDLGLLTSAINQANIFFQDKALRQINKYLTLRNWVIGCYIVEYEQHGKDRAIYGNQVLDKLAERLKEKNTRGFSKSNLKLFRLFYLNYPQIINSVKNELQHVSYQSTTISQSVTGQFKHEDYTPAETLLNKLSFTHIAELLRITTLGKRQFYELKSISDNWSVRDLERAITSRLFERTISNKKEILPEKIIPIDLSLLPKDIIKDPYILEFLELEEKPADYESDLEQRVIDHIQKFLLELGNGFCFESRQKRISIEGTHLYVDLVFYHRILKCHVLVELKMNSFSYSDAGQMNVYINYFKDNEMIKGDNPPIGIILCTDKNSTMVKYATSGMSDNIFVSQYLSKLPSEAELREIIEEEKKMLPIRA